MSVNPVRIGLLGVGKMGQNHLRVLSMLNSVTVKFIHDADPALAERLGSKYGVPIATELEPALAEVDAVVICTPTVTHSQYIERVAPHVRYIFVEKPLAHDLQSSEHIHRFAREKNLNLQVGFIERFNPAVQQLKRVLDKSSGVVSVDFVRTNKLSSRITDVDVVTDLMIHDIDLALYLNGPVTSVSAHGVVHGGMVEFASALLTHVNGRFSRIQASRITDKKMRSIEATCTDMFVACELVRKEIVISRQSEIQQKENEPYTITAMEETVEVRPQEALLSELQAFVANCRGERDPSTPDVDDGLNAMQICERIQKAVRQ
jgi:predicted dehydrogenase